MGRPDCSSTPSPRDTASICRAGSLACCLAVLCAGAAVVIVQALGVGRSAPLIDLLRRVPIMSGTAFMMAAASTICGHRPGSRLLRAFGVLAALGVAISGVYALGTYQGLWRAHPGMLTGAVYGAKVLPTLNGAINWTLLGLALLQTHLGGMKGRVTSQFLLFPVAFLSLMAFLGHGSGVSVLRAFPGGPAAAEMPLLSALLFTCLCAAAVCQSPDRGLMGIVARPGPGGMLARRIFLTVLTVPAALAILLAAGGRSGLYSRGAEQSLLTLAIILIFGTLTWFSAQTLDRTDRQRLAAEAERAELLERERAARRQAEEALRMRDEVVAMVSHDLKNPLTGVLLNVSLLRPRLVGDDRALRALLNIQLASERMLRMVADLLDVHRLESGQPLLVEDPVPGNLADVVLQAIESQRAQAEQKSIRILTNFAPSLPPVPMVSARIHQLLQNLLGNAIKFTPRHGRIEVRLDSAPPGDAIVCRIEDSGPGIDAELIPRLFDRFSQAKATASQGTGLGLAIAKGIAEAHGGRIWVESRPGHGATFSFALPREGREREPGREGAAA